MKITSEERQLDPNKERLFNKLAYVAYRIKYRTSNPKFKQYNNYGGRGVTMDPKWESAFGFIDDADKIDGWNEQEFLLGNLELDKDIKIPGNTVYCLEATKWVTHKENMQTLPEVQKPFYAYNQYTQEIRIGTNLNKFASDTGTNASTISGVLHGRKHKSGDWWVWYTDYPTPVIKRVYFKDKSGNVIWDVNSQRLSKKLGRNRAYVSQKLLHPERLAKGESVWEESVDVQSLLNKYNA